MDGGVSHGHTLDVLELDVAQGDQAVLLAVLLGQLQGLRGFAPLRVVKVHGARQVDEDLHALWRLCCAPPRGLEGEQEKEQKKRPKQEMSAGFPLLLLLVTFYITFTFGHFADALIQSDLQSVQGHSPQGK